MPVLLCHLRGYFLQRQLSYQQHRMIHLGLGMSKLSVYWAGVCETLPLWDDPFPQKIQVCIQQVIWGWSALYDQHCERGLWQLWQATTGGIFVCVDTRGICLCRAVSKVSLAINIRIVVLWVLDVPLAFHGIEIEGNHATYAGGGEWVHPAQQNCAH